MRKILRMSGILVIMVTLASCGLLPEEQALRTAPMVADYERETFNLAYVERGDVISSQKVYLVYVPVRTEALAFQVGGEYYDEVYVKVGDSVKQRDLLAQLRVDDVLKEIDAVSAELGKMRLQLTHLEENRTLSIERINIASQADDPESLKKALEDMNLAYDRQRERLNDQIYIQTQRLEELAKERDKRQLRASFDGTVTYVRSVNEGAVSTAGERFITVSDSTVSVFRAETELWDKFHIGDEYEILVNKTPYQAVVANPKELGVEEAGSQPGQKGYIYLLLNQPSFDLEGGDRGSLTMVLDQRKDVLTLPSKAITTANGRKIVYYQTAEGVKSYKYIETGLDNGEIVEIISGLDEGDSVIMK